MLSLGGPDVLHESTQPWRVAWTRGQACRQVAEALGDGSSRPLQSDRGRSCIADRIDLLVARRLSSFDLVPLVVPHDVDLDRIESVTAAVSDGPHSDLAAAIAARLAHKLGSAGELATLYRTPAERSAAVGRLQRIGRLHPSLARRTVEANTAAALVHDLGPATLLVLGAPGGSWLQRQIFGPGHRLTVAAPGGALVARSAPRRCFHASLDLAGRVVGPHLTVTEGRRLLGDVVIPVAEGGRLVGIVRRDALRTAPDGLQLGDIMEPPVSVSATESLEAARDLHQFLDGGPIPVVDNAGHLIGMIPPAPGEARQS